MADASGAFVITGAGQGLGKQLASAAFRAGYPLALIGRTEAKLTRAKQELEELFGTDRRITCHAVDLSDENWTRAAFEEIAKAHGSIRVLVNNAATWMGEKSVAELSREEIQSSFDLCFFTAFNATKATLTEWRRSQGPGPCIVNVGATASLEGWGKFAAFSMGKGALRMFSQSLARELGPEGVHVVHLVIDGKIDNERTRRLNKSMPTENFLKPESIAKTILHLAGQDRSCWTFECDVRPYNESW